MRTRHYVLSLSLPIAAALVAPLAALALAAPVTEVPTAWVYTYTSSPFVGLTGVYQSGDRLTGTLTVDPATAFAVDGPGGCCRGLSYSFTDGHQTLTEANSTALFTLNRSILAGAPLDAASSGWVIRLTGSTGGLVTVAGPVDGRVGDIHDAAWLGPDFTAGPDRGWNNIDGGYDGRIFITGAPPGTWTVEAVPEPSTLALLAVGLGAVALRGLRRRSWEESKGLERRKAGQ